LLTGGPPLPPELLPPPELPPPELPPPEDGEGSGDGTTGLTGGVVVECVVVGAAAAPPLGAVLALW
jgi:hypothetical protein